MQTLAAPTQQTDLNSLLTLPTILNNLVRKIENLENKFEQQTDHNSTAADEFINAKEVAKLIGVQPQSVYRLTCYGKLPYYKPKGTGKALFIRKEVLEWIKSNRIDKSINPVHILAEKHRSKQVAKSL